MKANEYVAKYMTGIESEKEFTEKAKQMFSDFAKEYSEICKIRGVKTLSGQEGVIRELNDKWNAVALRVNKMYPDFQIVRHAIWNLFLSETDPVRWPPKNST